MDKNAWQKSVPYIGGITRFLVIVLVGIVGCLLIQIPFPLSNLSDTPLGQLTFGTLVNSLVSAFIIFLLLRFCFKWFFIERNERDLTDQQWINTGVAIVLIIIAILCWVYFDDYHSRVAAAAEEKASCLALQPQLQAQIDQYNAGQQPSYGCATTDPCGTYVGKESFDQVFYSSKLNNCVDVTISATFLETDQGPKVQYQDFLINNANTGQYIDSINATQHGSAYATEDQVNQKIGEYR